MLFKQKRKLRYRGARKRERNTKKQTLACKFERTNKKTTSTRKKTAIKVKQNMQNFC